MRQHAALADIYSALAGKMTDLAASLANQGGAAADAGTGVAVLAAGQAGATASALGGTAATGVEAAVAIIGDAAARKALADTAGQLLRDADGPVTIASRGNP